MLKKIVLLCLFVCVAGSAYKASAVEYNFSLSDFAVFSTELTSENVEIIQYPQLSGWFSHVFNDRIDMIISAGVRLKWTHLPQNDVEFIPFVGHTALNLKFSGPSALPLISLSLGRLPVADFSGRLFSGLMDGVSSSFTFSSGVKLGFSAAYTGLVLLDDLEISKTAYNTENPVLLKTLGNRTNEYAPPRVISTLSMSNIRALKRRLQFSAEVIGSFDTKSEWIHAQYAVLNMGATLSPGMVYSNVYAIASLAEQKSVPGVTAGFALGGILNLLVPIKTQGMFDKVFAGIDYASGKASGSFYPVLSTSLTQNADLPFSSVMRVVVGNSFRMNSFAAHVDASVFVTEETAGLSYFASEVSLRLIWAPVADFQLIASGSYLIPAKAAVNNPWTASAGFVFNF